MQLEATLRSLALRCHDLAAGSLTVLYKTTSDEASDAYRRLAASLTGVTFLEELDFKAQLEALLDGADAVLFLVDDNVFVRPFGLGEALAALAATPDALGFSLRVGRNTTYCYSLDRGQRLPAFEPAAAGALAFTWPDAECDFAYPLEVSSSIFWTRDLLPLLRPATYRHPNGLEELLAAQAGRFQATRPRHLCLDRSVTFCVPANRVQESHPNRAGGDPALGAGVLLRRFLLGDRIDVEALAGFTPIACHQEVPLWFVEATPGAGTRLARPGEPSSG